MKKQLLSAVLLAGLAFAGQGRAAEPDQAQIEQVIERFKAAIIAHDQKGLEALFVPEGGAWFEVLGEDAFRRIKARKPDLSRVHLLFPRLAWWLLRRPSLGKALVVGSGVVAFGMAVRGYVWLHAMAPVMWKPGPAFGLRFVEGIYYPIWARLDGLLAGVALAALRVGRPQVWAGLQRRAGVVLAAGLGLFVLAWWLFRERLGFWPSVVGYPLLSLALALCVGAATALPVRWAVPGAGWLARISYSLYLSHKLALHAVATWWVEPWQQHGLAAFGLYAVGVLLVGAGLYYAVERPFLRWRERLDGRRPALAAEMSAAA